MSMRCPSSYFVGLGRLLGYRWMINDRGYANVVASSDPESEVYGFVYSLTEADKSALDRNEGVPFAYQDETLPVLSWTSNDGLTLINVSDEAEMKQMLVYIDRKRTVDDLPKEEYIYRMNMGIEDGVRHGIPTEYIERVLRPFIPAVKKTEVEGLAKRQALNFEDE